MTIRTLNKFFISAMFIGIGIAPLAKPSAQERNSSDLGTGNKNTITSTSRIDWTKEKFISNVSLDTEKAGINIPSGKKEASITIDREIPLLIKDPLLSLYVNNRQQLGDLVLGNNITLEQLTKIIDDGKKSPGVFTKGTLTLNVTHELNLFEIGSLMIKHHVPYKNAKPIEKVASKKYSGIIIDARGKLPVHGEFVSDSVYPCFFPEIWDDDMNLIYERNMGDPELEKTQGMIHYDWNDNEALYKGRVGLEPLHIKARKVYGENRTDPVISRNDALKILTVPENLELLRQGKIVVLLDKENLVHSVEAPEKTSAYYTAVEKIKRIFENEKDDDEPMVDDGKDKVIDSWEGVKILANLKFIADSPKLLPSELPKLKKLAEDLSNLTKHGGYTIKIEGHTADVNKPTGQQILSEERAKSIMNELIANGLDAKIFTYKGYGGTAPVATNSTAEGRAANRRVEITATPTKTTSIMKR
ncbi:MAG: OmpA family protein [Treponema sp.]|nr:OmpA family protein [Treponema sp.]